MELRIPGRLTELRPAAQEDAELLRRWHADPEVARYWDGKVYSFDEMRRRLARPDVDPFIIEAESEPVGYIQAWREEDGGLLDMFLIPGARGRGYGPDAARALAARLVEEGWRRITTDPYTSNERGIRAWAKAGFQTIEEQPPDDDHSSTWMLMEWRP